MPTFLSPDADNSQDLMLLQLREPANTTEAVRVTEEPTEEAKLGSRCLASGWGSTRPDKCMPGSDPVSWSRKFGSGRTGQATELLCSCHGCVLLAHSSKCKDTAVCGPHPHGQ